MSTGLPLGLAVLTSACTQVNPAFGQDTDAVSGTGDTADTADTADTQDDDSVSASTTMTTSASTTVDPSDSSASDTGVETMDCGNGMREGEEQCDDGNEVDDDECSNACVPETCGNQMHDEGEDCDSTAANSDVLCTPECQINICHDGYQLGEEKCDDGNTDDDDDCVDACQFAACGDFHVHADVEECDDGNAENDDECVACVPAQCGDGFVHADMEGCDPEMDASFACAANGFFDGEGLCTKACEVDLSSCTNCGDGILDVGDGEECDFGAEEVQTCAEAGWQGIGNVSCADCQATPMGECCLPDESPCIPYGEGQDSLCCGQCNQDTEECEGADG